MRVVLAVGFVLGLCGASAAWSGSMGITIDISDQHQVIHSFGASDCWKSATRSVAVGAAISAWTRRSMSRALSILT